MANPSVEVETEVSINGTTYDSLLGATKLTGYPLAAARNFVETYYGALNDKRARATLSSFYIQPTPTNPLVADISLNGNIVPMPADLQILFESQLPKAHYEAQCFDCHVLNPNYNIGASDAELGPDPNG